MRRPAEQASGSAGVPGWLDCGSPGRGEPQAGLMRTRPAARPPRWSRAEPPDRCPAAGPWPRGTRSAAAPWQARGWRMQASPPARYRKPRALHLLPRSPRWGLAVACCQPRHRALGNCAMSGAARDQRRENPLTAHGCPRQRRSSRPVPAAPARASGRILGGPGVGGEAVAVARATRVCFMPSCLRQGGGEDLSPPLGPLAEADSGAVAALTGCVAQACCRRSLAYAPGKRNR